MNRKKSLIQGLLVTAALAVLAACAQTPEELPEEYHEWAFTQARTVDLPHSAADALENAQVGDVMTFGETALGADSTYAISERYFAASGRPCFKGQLISEQTQQRMVVCRYSRNQWVATRAVAEKFTDTMEYEYSESTQ